MFMLVVVVVWKEKAIFDRRTRCNSHGCSSTTSMCKSTFLFVFFVFFGEILGFGGDWEGGRGL